MFDFPTCPSGRPPRKITGSPRDEKSVAVARIEEPSKSVFLPAGHMRVPGGMFGQVVNVATRIGLPEP